MNLIGNSQEYSASNSIAYKSDTVKIKGILINDSTVSISKTTAQNILKFKDSVTQERKAFKALSLNYSRLKIINTNKDTLIRFKDRQLNAAKKVIANQNLEVNLWAAKSAGQNKEIKKQKTLKWLAIVGLAVVSGIAIVK